MNEQIREFMLLAGTDTSGKWMGVEHVERLAELIVRECMSVADLPKNSSGQWDHLESSEVIAKHFGVAE